MSKPNTYSFPLEIEFGLRWQSNQSIFPYIKYNSVLKFLCCFLGEATVKSNCCLPTSSCNSNLKIVVIKSQGFIAYPAREQRLSSTTPIICFSGPLLASLATPSAILLFPSCSRVKDRVHIAWGNFLHKFFSTFQIQDFDIQRLQKSCLEVIV